VKVGKLFVINDVDAKVLEAYPNDRNVDEEYSKELKVELA